tara:strand:- start:64 stop:408 length:345 start_codon:yes stop_codon:yes gene_type:complete
MDFYLFLNILEREFLLLTGVSFPGFLGLLSGSALFSLLLFLLRYEKKTPLETNTDNFDDVGDPDEARINLSRSLFEMGQTAKAQELLQEVLSEENLSEENQMVIQSLLKKFSHA